MERAILDGVELDYEVRGEGEPILLIHGSHMADAQLPLMSEPALDRYQLIRYHRRGFAGSTHTPGPVTMADQAADAAAVLREAGVDKAHVVGHSYGAATALQLAFDSPEVVQSLVLKEPPVLAAPRGEATFAALGPIIERYAAGDSAGAVTAFLAWIGRPDSLVTIEALVPGAVT